MTVVTPIGNAVPDVAEPITEGVSAQLSVTVGAAQVATAVVPVVVKLILEGQLTMTGFSVSVAHGSILTTVTVKIHGIDALPYLAAIG